MNHFVTGFPGFLATHLVQELANESDASFSLLVEARFENEAIERVETLGLEKRTTIVTGDIVESDLGLEPKTYKKLAKSATHVWHLAAIYDLTVSETIAYKVNVMGTVHTMDFCETCKNLQAFNYISTCYVAGRREGTIFEDELDEGQSHFNHYESTKFWAEVEVNRRDLPTIVLRPSIVMGHSKTGETDKFDGPYHLLKILKRVPQWMPFPNLGDSNAKINIIPVDYAARALATIGRDSGSVGKTFHIADPNPMRPPEIVDIALESLDRLSVGSVPPKLMSMAVQNRRFEKWLGTPKQVIDYFRHNAKFDTNNARDILFEHDVVCPHLSNYFPVLIDYFENHPERDLR